MWITHFTKIFLEEKVSKLKETSSKQKEVIYVAQRLVGFLMCQFWACKQYIYSGKLTAPQTNSSCNNEHDGLEGMEEKKKSEINPDKLCYFMASIQQLLFLRTVWDTYLTEIKRRKRGDYGRMRTIQTDTEKISSVSEEALVADNS